MAALREPSFQIRVDHLSRVEGHGNIVVDARHGLIERCALEIIEAPRFFEAMLRGKPYTLAPRLASRICGICAVTHTVTSITTIERALGVCVSEQTNLLRRLNLCGEMLDSHLLHVYALALPDLTGAGSLIELARTSPGAVTRALGMKKVAGDLCAIIGGRHTHPISMTVGGFSHLPANEDLEIIYGRLMALRPDAEATADLYAGLILPDFERDTEYIALRDGGYCLLGNIIESSDGDLVPVEQYQSVTNEYQTAHSTAKHARHRRSSYMVGALARFNLNHSTLHPAAQEAANQLKLKPGCANPYMINAAQVVEIVHFLEEAIRILDCLLARGIDPELPAEPAHLSGEGVGACEAPRGTLYHHYTIRSGTIVTADCVIPTAQNLANIEADMHALVPQRINESPNAIRQALEMLVRAYDPCISCSTHMLEVSFV